MRIVAGLIQIASIALLAIAAPVARAQNDNFNDNAIGSEWTAVIDSGSTLNLAEQNQRIEVLATGSGASSQDAIYLSNGLTGFRLSTSSDFEIAIDYAFPSAASTGSASDALALVLGVGRDLDGIDSAAIGFSWVNVGFGTVTSLVAASRVDDIQTSGLIAGGTANGTFDS